jgi:hypothetical protein
LALFLVKGVSGVFYFFLLLFFKYERLQKQERDVLQQMYTIQVEPTVTYPSTKVKPTINLTDQQKDQFEDLQRKNLRLERERQGKSFLLLFFIK